MIPRISATTCKLCPVFLLTNIILEGKQKRLALNFTALCHCSSKYHCTDNFCCYALKKISASGSTISNIVTNLSSFLLLYKNIQQQKMNYRITKTRQVELQSKANLVLSIAAQTRNIQSSRMFMIQNSTKPQATRQLLHIQQHIT